MNREPLVFVGTCDLAGLVRGKGFPAAELCRRMRKRVGLTHSNIMMSPFGPIYETPFGTAGDLMLMPNPTTRVEVEFDDVAERFYLADILTTDKQPWEYSGRQYEVTIDPAELRVVDGLSKAAMCARYAEIY